MVSGLSGLASNGIVTTFDPVTSAFLRRTTGSYTLGQINKLDALIRAFRRTGLIDAANSQFEFLHLYDWGANQADALLDLFDDTKNATVGGSGGVVFTQGVGIQTGSASYLDSNFSSSSGLKFTQNSATLGVWIPGGRASSSSSIDMGCLSGSSASLVQYRFTGGLNRVRINDAGSGLTVAFAVCKMLAARRTASNAMQLIRDGLAVSSATTASTSRVARNVYTGALNNNGSAANFTSETYGKDWCGSAFSDQQYADFYTAMNVFSS